MSENELRYHISIFIIKNLLDEDLITKEVYEKVNRALIEKYKPVFYEGNM